MAVNDRIMSSLVSHGGGTINERVYNYLGSLGYTGTISDRLAKYTHNNKHGWQALIEGFGLSGSAGVLRQELFGEGQEGVMYVPQPTYLGQQVLYQDSAGTTPVASDGDPTGLMLDLSRGLALGPELVTNGAFGTDSASWLSYSGAILSAVEGELRVEDANSVGGAYQDVTVETGKAYRFECAARGAGFNTVRVYGSDAFALPIFLNYGSPGELQGVFVAESSVVRVYLSVDSGVAYFDNITVRELPGNHATQSTSASRPIYPGLSYDGVDDKIEASVSISAVTSADLAVKISPSDTQVCVFSSPEASGFFLVSTEGSSSSAASGMGSPNVMVDKTTITTRGQLYDALSDGEWHVVSIRGADFSNAAWSSLVFGTYPFSSSFQLTGSIGAVVFSEASDDRAYDYVAAMMSDL